MTRIIHAADLHLSLSHKRRLGVEGDAVHSLKQLVQIAIARKADVVILAGDIFDSSFPTCDAVSSFMDGMQQLHEAGIPVAFITGNHDPNPWPIVYKLPNVFALHGRSVPLSIGAARIYGINFLPSTMFLESLLSVPDDANIVVCHCMVEEFTGGLFSSDCSVGDLPLAKIDGKSAFRYYALGDLHKNMVLVYPPRKLIVAYPGSTFCTAIDEEVDKSVIQVNVSDGGEITTEKIPLVTRRIYRLDLQTEEQLRRALADDGIRRQIVRESSEMSAAGHEVVSRPVVEVQFYPIENASARLADAFAELSHLYLRPRTIIDVEPNSEIEVGSGAVNMPELFKELMADAFDQETVNFTQELLNATDTRSVINNWAERKNVVLETK